MADELADVLENRVMREILATGNPTETDSPAQTLREFSPERTAIMPVGFVLLPLGGRMALDAEGVLRGGAWRARRYPRE